MRRKIKRIFSFNALKSLFYIPLIIYNIKNWQTFLLNYSGVINSCQDYLLRNDVIIKTHDPIDCVTIAVVFIKKDYGNVLDNSVVIDIGANIGAYSIFAITRSTNSIVYAYEPMSKNFSLLKKNITANNLENNIVSYKLGVGPNRKKTKLYLGNASPYHSIYSNRESIDSEIIDLITIKDIFDDNKIEQCDLLKIDCEGAEFDTFYNTPSHYFTRINKICMEYHNRDNNIYNIKHLARFLNNKGFRTIKIKKTSNIIIMSRV